MKPYPVIAIIGHPNEGKSSVLSTLTEDDSVVVSDYPGETVVCQRFPVQIGSETVMEFVDTPGFQNPIRLLQSMRESGLTDEKLLDYIHEKHGADADYHHDLELMKPLREGAGLIYVVDCSRPLLEEDKAEMEILRLINRPRMAVINFKDEDREYMEAWKLAFRRHFNVIREFNAHQARFQERIALLETLKAIQQDWEPAINRAIEAYHKDWDYRKRRVVEDTVRYLEWALNHKAERKYTRESDSESVRQEITESYKRKIEKEEQRLFSEIRRLYKHHLYDFKLPEQSILKEELFSEETWQVLGLTQKQLLVSATTLGAGLGAALDVAASGLTFGVFTAAGALAGGGGMLFKGKELSKIRINRLPMGGFSMTAGPSKNPQFPFILLDRVLLYFQVIASHSHGKRISNSEGQSIGPTGSSTFTKDEVGNLTQLFRQLSSSSSQSRRDLVVNELSEILSSKL